MSEVQEGIGVPKTNLAEFFQDLRGKLTLITGLVDYESLGLTLEEVRKPMLVIGLPGIGKTAGIQNIVKELNTQLPPEKQLGFKKILLGQTVVGSLSGIPVVMPDGSVKRVQMPDLPDESRDGKYGVLFLDEITTADEMQIQPALGLADDSRNIGEYTLPEGWIVVGAGNGPDCTNFVRLDDMTISRFVPYDIVYNYALDFRPYAHASGLNPDIIAYLNFEPDACVRVESNEMDRAGKIFPCPRTWERLSVELKMRRALGNTVSIDRLANFAGKIVGIKAGRDFASFSKFKTQVGYSADKIFDGTERKPDDMERQCFHIILQACIKKAQNLLKTTVVNECDYPLSTYQQIRNMLVWFLSIDDLESQINTITEIRDDLPELAELIMDADFAEICPEFQEFIIKYEDTILEVML